MEKSPYLAIAPNEPIQPIRLHYRVKKKKVYDLFQRLSYITYTKERKAFEWYFTKEIIASYKHELPAGVRPGDAIMAYMRFSGEKELRVNVLSTSRALTAISFLDEKFGSRTMRLVGVDFSNWFYDASEENKNKVVRVIDPFEGHEDDIYRPNPREMEDLMEEAVEQGKSIEEAREAALAILEVRDKQPHPEFEHRKVTHVQEDLYGLKMMLTIRHRIASHRYAGDETYSTSDAVLEIDRLMHPEDYEDEEVVDAGE